MALTLRRKVSLAFLGEGYEDAYIIFKRIPLKDYEKLMAEMPSTEDKTESNKVYMKLIPKCLKDYFISGVSPDGDITKEDIDELDAESTIACFQALTGQEVDPKLEAPLTNTSTTEPDDQQK